MDGRTPKFSPERMPAKGEVRKSPSCQIGQLSGQVEPLICHRRPAVDKYTQAAYKRPPDLPPRFCAVCRERTQRFHRGLAPPRAERRPTDEAIEAPRKVGRVNPEAGEECDHRGGCLPAGRRARAAPRPLAATAVSRSENGGFAPKSGQPPSRAGASSSLEGCARIIVGATRPTRPKTQD